MRSKFKWIFTLLVALSMQFSFAQDKTVTGTITDGKLPLPGANVVIKGTAKGVSADMDGKFSIKAKSGDVLVISFSGYDNKSLTVGSANSYNVALKENTKVLDDVVIKGAMGIGRKTDAQTSAQQVVKAKELTQAANPNVIQSLIGKVSGLQINTTSGGVNATTRIVLRGLRTITGNAEALVVIDNSISTAAILAQLAPEIIESVNVIKGAQGAALYGDQGSNGVIIVTTKKGTKNNKIQVNINSSVDFESISFLPRRQSNYGQGWANDFNFNDGTGLQQNHVAFENGAWGPSFSDPYFAGTMQATGLPQANGQFIMAPWKGDENNIKKFFTNGLILQNGVSVNMGNEDGYALLSFNRQNRDFIVGGDKSVRNNFLFKGGKNIGRFNLNGSINYVSQSSTETDAGLFEDLLQTATNIPVELFSDGLNEHHWTAYYRSPYWKQKHERYNDNNDIFVANANLGYKINKNIDVNYSANLNYRNSLSQYHNDGFNTDYAYTFPSPYTYAGSADHTYDELSGGGFITSSYYVGNTNRRNYYGNLIFNFDYKLTDKIGAKFNVGSDLQDNLFRVVTNGGTGIDKPGIYNVSNLLNYSLDATADTPGKYTNGAKLDNRTTRYRKVGAYVNSDFSYQDFFFVNATARYEKASTIKSSQFYPGIGASFVPTALGNLKGMKVLNYAKFTASYVTTGNASAVNPTETQSSNGVLGTGYPFGSLNSFVYSTTQVDPNIKPEFVTTKEFGTNLGFFNNRITLGGAYYISDTKDLITNSTTSSASGVASLKTNVGNLQNKGIEIDLGLTPIKSESGFNWNMKLSYASNRTKITSLAAGVNEVSLFSNTNAGIYAVVGEEFPMIKGTAYIRDPQGNIIVDATGTPKVSTTFQNLGKTTPDYILGFTNSFEYKGLKLTAVLDFRTGHKMYSETIRNLSFAGHLLESGEIDRTVGYVVPNSVQETTPGVYTANTTPARGGGYTNTWNYFDQNFGRTGEAQVIDATALKVRELALSYSLPKKFIEKAGIASLTFGVNTRNPFVLLGNPFKGKSTFSNKGYTDPEASVATAGSGLNSNGIGWSNIGQYPSTKTYGFSVNLTF